jgi:creatinine amidohydrolase
MDVPESTDKDSEYRYNRLTWPEMNDAIARQPVVILPTGSTEQHGRHARAQVIAAPGGRGGV